ncbi:TPA: discoidin domain-containing protein [Streptococcus suis]|nr:discoidin domain-containing protein [Streptococcus suis]HEM6137160.1 discoidin domain-containing protein [Streptococcus suis]
MKRLNRNYQYSIRKTSLGIGSVAIGVLLAGLSSAPKVAADTISTPSGTETISTTVATGQTEATQAVTETSVAPSASTEEVVVSSTQAGTETVPVSDLNPAEQEVAAQNLPSDVNTQATTSSAELEAPVATETSPVYQSRSVAEAPVSVAEALVEVEIPVDPTYVEVTSNDPEGDKTHVIDNKSTTHWASNPSSPNSTSNPQTVTVRLTETAEVSQVLYTPRQETARAVGNIKVGKIFHSIDGKNWQEAIPTAIIDPETGNSEGLVGSNDNSFHLNANRVTKAIEIEPVTARYFKLLGIETYHWNPSKLNQVVAAAEFKPIGVKRVSADSLFTIDPRYTTATSWDAKDGGGRKVSYATDGNPNTLWQSNNAESDWNKNATQYLTVGLTEKAKVNSIDITPRQDGESNQYATGDIKRGYIEYKTDQNTWQRVNIVGSTDNVFVFDTSKQTKIVQFSPVEAQFFRIAALDTYHWQSAAKHNTLVAVAEVSITGRKINSNPTVENQDIVLENDYMSRNMIVRDGKLRTVNIVNKLPGNNKETVEFLEGSKEFVIQFKPDVTDTTPAPSQPLYEPESKDRSQWLVSTNSQANASKREGSVQLVLDGDQQTIWHSNYHNAGTGPHKTLPAYVDITFPTAKDIRTLIYLPRQDGPENVNGLIKDYKLYIKEKGQSDFTLFKEGTITSNPKQAQYIDFGQTKKNVQAIRFEAISSQNGQPYAAIAELDISSSTVAQVRARQEARQQAYQKELDAYQARTQISLDKLTLAEDGVIRVKTAQEETITYTFKPFTYKNVPVTVQYVMNLKKEAKFSQSHIVISVPEQFRSSLTIDTIDLQRFQLADNQKYEEFSKQAAIAEMANFDGFHAGLGQPVYLGSFYTGSEFPIAWNTVDGTSNQLLSRYYSGKTLAELDLDENGNYRTWNTVVGVARSNDYSVLQQDFYDYIAKIGTKTYFRKQYNSWYDLMKNITAENIQSSFNEIDRGFTNGGISPLDSFVVDDGWQNVRSLWDFNSKFPNKLYDSSKQVKRFGSDFGLWMGPRGGYGTEGTMANYLAENNLGSKTPAGDVYIGDKRYVDGLKELFANYGQEFDINYWKLDGMLRYPQQTTDTAGNYIGGGYKNMYSMTEAHERWIELYNIIRDNAPSADQMWINLTSYIPPSPWFLQWVNSIWMQNTADVDYQDGVKKAPYDTLDFGNDVNEALTYRDDSYEKLVRDRKWQIPFSNIYNHDPVYGATAHTSKKMTPLGPARDKINFSTEDFRTYLYMLGTRGTGFWEFYYSPSMLDDAKWQVNGEAVKWIESNFETLRNAVYHGGQPREGEVYGYSAWDPNNGIVSVRNPIDKEQSYELRLDRIVGMREGTTSLHRVTVLGDKRHDTSSVTNYGDVLRITLKPYETVIFQYSTSQDKRPAQVFEAKAITDNTITLEFDERVVIDKASFTVAGHTVKSVKLNENLRTVTLQLGKNLTDREKVSVNYSNVKDNAGLANLSNGKVNFTNFSNGLIQDISRLSQNVSLDNDGVEGRGVFSVTVKATLNRLGQTLAEQLNQWKLSVDEAGRAVFEVKGEKVTSAPFTQLSTADRGQADKLIAVGEEVTITAVRVANGSLRIYINGELHNSHYNSSKLNQQLSRSTLKLAGTNFAGTFSRFILENKARDFETALELYQQLNPGKKGAALDTSLTSATSFDSNDGGERRASLLSDGNKNTYWVSSPTQDNSQTKQQVVIGLQTAQSVAEVQYTPRQDAANAVGNIKKAYLEYSLDGKTWKRVTITNGNTDNTISFQTTTATSSIRFAAVQAKYFRLTALETHHWRPSMVNKIVAVAELKVIPSNTVVSLTTGYLLNAIDQAHSIVTSRYTAAQRRTIQTELAAARTALQGQSQVAINTANDRLRAALAGRTLSTRTLDTRIQSMLNTNY